MPISNSLVGPFPSSIFQSKNFHLINLFHLGHFENDEVIIEHLIGSSPSFPSGHHKLGFFKVIVDHSQP